MEGSRGSWNAGRLGSWVTVTGSIRGKPEAGSLSGLLSFRPRTTHHEQEHHHSLTTTALDSLGTGDTGSRQPCSSRRAQRFRSPSRETPRRTNTKLTVARLSGSARAPGQSQLFESLSPDKSGDRTRYMPCARRLLRLHSALPVSPPR